MEEVDELDRKMMRRLRKHLRLTQKEVAHAAGIHSITFSEMERGGYGDLYPRVYPKILTCFAETRTRLIDRSRERHERFVDEMYGLF